MQTVAETPTFARQSDRLFTDEERRVMIDYPAENPLAGEELPETGGVRKLRFAAPGRGKQGGARVIQFNGEMDVPVFARLAYANSARPELKPAERCTVTETAAAINLAGTEGP